MKLSLILFFGLMLISAPLAQQTQNALQLKVTYNPDKDETLVETPIMMTLGNDVVGKLLPTDNFDQLFDSLMTANAQAVGMVLRIYLEGKALDRPEEVGMLFLSVGKLRHWETDREPVILADGNKYRLGQFQMLKNGKEEGIVFEIITGFVPFSTLEKISASKTVECKIADREFPLPSAAHSVIRELVSKFPPR